MRRPIKNPVFQQIGFPIAAFACCIVAGIGGFVYLGNVGVLDATFWLLDPTSIELHGAGDDVKAYALVVFAGLILSGIWIGETVVTAAFGGRIREELQTMQQEQQLESLEEHYVVCGYGMLGRTVASELRDASEDVVVIEVTDANYEKVVDDGFLAIKGDARRDQVLTGASIDQCRAVIAAVDDSNTNIQIAIVTTQLAPHAEVIVRVGEELYEPLARRAGADAVIIPEVVSGKSILDRIA